jgi:hypothetical protein
MNRGSKEHQDPEFDEDAIARYAKRFPEEHRFPLSIGIHKFHQGNYDEAVTWLEQASDALRRKVEQGADYLRKELATILGELEEARAMLSAPTS